MSPTVRLILTAVAAGVAALGGLIATGTVTDLPEWVGVFVAVLSAMFGALNIVPPQVGGAQEGLASPTIVEPPPADVSTRRSGPAGR